MKKHQNNPFPNSLSDSNLIADLQMDTFVNELNKYLKLESKKTVYTKSQKDKNCIHKKGVKYEK